MHIALALVGACGFAPGMYGDAGVFDAPADDSVDISVDTKPVRVTSGLVAYYTFEESGGASVIDRSGFGTPLDLTVGAMNATWGTGTLTITGETLVASAGAATKVLDACRTADALTLEAWISPTMIGGYFPRVVTLSSSNSDLAATLMAIDDHFEFRMLGPGTDSDGLPSLNSPAGTVTVAQLHVALVSEPGGARHIYVGGTEVASDALGGDLATWGANHRLALGNELDGARPWLGTFDTVAIYARALTPAEIAQNVVAGPQ